MNKNEESDELFHVIVTMQISKKGKVVDTKQVDLGEVKDAQVKGLADLFSMLAANVEYLKKLTPQLEKLDKSKPTYLQ